MKGRKGFTLIELLVVIAIIAVLAAILFPVFAKARNAAKASNCQSNMTQIGRAVKMYLTDWEDTYPTNRMKPNMYMSSQVFLSPYDPTNQERFKYGVNWVEGLFNYVEATTKQSDSTSVWRCQAASNASYPLNSKTAAVTYTFNYNLLEQPEGIIKGSANLMLVREMDRLVEAICRPVNDSTGARDKAPMSPFLVEKDYMMRGVTVDATMHSKGSNILFADGHVKYFSADYFPETNLTTNQNWDEDTQQWWNWVATKRGLDKTIAITP